MTSLMCIIPSEIDQFLSQCEKIKSFWTWSDLLFTGTIRLAYYFKLYIKSHRNLAYSTLLSLSKLTKEEWQSAICSIYRYEAQ